MTSSRQWFEMLLALVFAIAATILLTAVAPDLATSAGAAVAATYVSSRSTWGGREAADSKLDAVFDDDPPFRRVRLK